MNELSLPDLIGQSRKEKLDYPVKFTRLRRRQRLPGPDNDKKRPF
jgi:hypothetical protein